MDHDELHGCFGAQAMRSSSVSHDASETPRVRLQGLASEECEREKGERLRGGEIFGSCGQNLPLHRLDVASWYSTYSLLGT